MEFGTNIHFPQRMKQLWVTPDLGVSGMIRPTLNFVTTFIYYKLKSLKY